MSDVIVVIGGTGVFGKRLCQHLITQLTNIDLVITSRSKKNAQLHAENLQRSARADNVVTGRVFDTKSDTLLDLLSEIAPDIVVDCSGPFQLANHSTAEIVLKAGAHYLDLADARVYLKTFSAKLDTEAVTCRKLAIAGCSSTPTLSTCVVRSLTDRWQRIDTIDIAITLGGKSDVGKSVVAAILSYTGKPIPSFDRGELGVTSGWGISRRIAVGDLGERLVSPVETLDAEHLSHEFTVKNRVSFSAGLESTLEHRSLQLLSWLRKHRVIPSPEVLAPFLLKVRSVSRISTSDRGGMVVNVTGLDENGSRARNEWLLLAEHDDGPYVPVLPAAAMIRRLLNEELTPGATLGSERLNLQDIENEMSTHAITTQTKKTAAQHSIFEHSLGEETFGKMPSALQLFHRASASTVWVGKGVVNMGSWPSKIIAKVFGFPSAGNNIPITVTVDHELDDLEEWQERWTRTFANTSFRSLLKLTDDKRLTESFPPFTFNIGVNANKKQLSMPVTGWRLGFITLPEFLAPVSDAKEYQDAQGRFCFDVKLSHPLIGLIAHYQGWLEEKG